MCRYNWHSAGFLGWPFSALKYKYILQIKYTEAISSNSTPKLLRFEIIGMLIAVLRNKLRLLRYLLQFSAYCRSLFAFSVFDAVGWVAGRASGL